MTRSTEASITLRDLSELLTQISSATGLTQQQLETQFEDVHVTVYRYENRNLVPPEEFDSIIDTWANSIKTQIRVPGKVTASPKKVVTKTKTTRRKSATSKAKVKKTTSKEAPIPRKRTVRTRKSSLPLPQNYKSVVSHLYGPSLKRIMPEDTARQRAFLEAIAQESAEGVALLKELSIIIADKYTGKMAPEAAYNGLKKKAQVLLDELSGKPKARRVAKRRVTQRGRKAATRTRQKRK